jgi:hypothetical protein
LDGPLQTSRFAFEHFPIGTNVNLCPAVVAILNFRSALKKQKLCRGPSNDHSWAVWFQLSKWFQRRKIATTAGHKLTLVTMGKCSNAFFSETTNTIKTKLYMNVHWMILYKLYVFCFDMKFKMAATAGLNLTLDPTGKMFQNASSLKPLG